jgi:glycine/D-amino acid oxidase-like deaminating enzyme
VDSRPPLTSRYSETSYWRSHVTPPSLGDHDVPREVDVVIVGSGYTGVSAARTLAKAGAAVCVLERETVGYGASTRNGGIVHPGLKLSVPVLERRYGSLGRELYDTTVDAFEYVEGLVGQEGIDCDYVRSGHVVLAHHAKHAPMLERSARVYREELGEEARFIPIEELADEIGTKQYYGGLAVELSGSMHPGKYYFGLLESARKAGATFVEHNPATRIVRVGPNTFAVDSPRGRILTRDVLIATNGYTGSATPELQRRVIPIGSFIIVTEPIDGAVTQSVSPRGRSFFSTQNFIYYWRVLPDNRVLFGGRASFAPTTVQRTRDILYKAMVDIHPQLGGVAVDFAWGGAVGFTFDQLPHVGQMEGLTYALGYCGTGVAMSTYSGMRCARWILGEQEPPPFSRLPFPTAPLYRGKPWFLRPAGLYFSMRDRFG